MPVWLCVCGLVAERLKCSWSCNQQVAGSNGVGSNFGVGVGEARPEWPRAGYGVFGEGAATTRWRFAGAL